MKIYTRKGDSGYTLLIDGKIVYKHNLSVAAYGTIDELNSFLGLLKDYIDDEKIKDVLNTIQLKLFSIGSILASGENQNISEKVKIEKKDVEYIELEIDRLNEYLPELKNFIIPSSVNSLKAIVLGLFNLIIFQLPYLTDRKISDKNYIY